MLQLAYLRQKIRSIQTTKKVTHAIRLVSMSLYSRLEKQDVALRYYIKNVRSLFTEHLRYAPEWKNTILFPDDILDSRPLFVVIASSKGLCGSLNSNIIRYAEQSIFLNAGQKASFITVGQKAYKFVKEKQWGNILYFYHEFNSNNFITIADSILEKIISGQSAFSSVSFLGTERRSFFNQRPYKMSLIPFVPEKFVRFEQNEHMKKNDQLNNYNSDDVIWEQKNEDILNMLSLSYLRCSIIEILFQSLLSEYSARFLAMDSSTTNAEKYLEKLTLQYNKARQAAITKEVSELSSGFLGL